MSYSVDTNILLYASDQKSRYHSKAERFLNGCMTSGETFYLCWTVAMAYLRIATHPAIFDSPLSPAEAMSNIESLNELPHCRFLSEGEGFWDCYKNSSDGLAIRGNHVPDMHLAALLRYHGVRRLYTHDRDFRRFDFLEVRDPLE